MLVCNCDPSGASVCLDGVPIGDAPVRKGGIPPGEHVLTLKKSGYEDSVGSVTIKPGVTLTVEDKMAEARGEWRITSIPSGAKVAIDGRDAGVTPVTIKRLATGGHTASFSLDYFEAETFKETFGRGDTKELAARLKRRVLVVKYTGDDKGDTSGRFFENALTAFGREIPGSSAGTADLAGLRSSLSAQGLDPGSISFIETGKAVLDLEDMSVLSNILEQAGCDLMLVIRPDLAGGVKGLTLGLYGSRGAGPDRFAFETQGPDGESVLMAKYLEFLHSWAAQERGTKPSVGAAFVDRPGGGVAVVRVVPGLPAAEAGIIPGDLITVVDGEAVRDKEALAGKLLDGSVHRLGYSEHGHRLAAELKAADIPVEAPPDSAGFLYNLAEAVLGMGDESEDLLTGIAALDAGNVHFRMKEYDDAVDCYRAAAAGPASGVGAGTAMYRLARAFDALGKWDDAAAAYRKVVETYPDATLGDADGPLAAPLSVARLKELRSQGLIK